MKTLVLCAVLLSGCTASNYNPAPDNHEKIKVHYDMPTNMICLLAVCEVLPPPIQILPERESAPTISESETVEGV